MIRIAALAAFAVGALAGAPALAFETQSAPAPRVSSDFTDSRVFAGMMPQTTSEPFHFGPAEPKSLTPDQPATKKPMVIYEVGAGKPAGQVDVTDPRDNPFLPQSQGSASRSSEAAR